jgi:hypothetical protein
MPVKLKEEDVPEFLLGVSEVVIKLETLFDRYGGSIHTVQDLKEQFPRYGEAIDALMAQIDRLDAKMAAQDLADFREAVRKKENDPRWEEVKRLLSSGDLVASTKLAQAIHSDYPRGR